MNEISVLNLFLEAGPVVKSVMLTLLLTSILTWIVIIERYNFYKKIKKINSDFLSRFWSGKDLHSLYNEIPNDNNINYGSLNVFRSAFDEFNTLNKTNEVTHLVDSNDEITIDYNNGDKWYIQVESDLVKIPILSWTPLK